MISPLLQGSAFQPLTTSMTWSEPSGSVVVATPIAIPPAPVPAIVTQPYIPPAEHAVPYGAGGGQVFVAPQSNVVVAEVQPNGNGQNVVVSEVVPQFF